MCLELNLAIATDEHFMHAIQLHFYFSRRILFTIMYGAWPGAYNLKSHQQLANNLCLGINGRSLLY